jgi:autotransporter-associated beta strand protein
MRHRNLGRHLPGSGILTALALGLCAAEAPTDIVQTPDALVINRGTFTCSDGGLRAIPQVVIAGTFFDNLRVSPKFPCGGTLVIHGADRLNPQGILAFKGGYLFCDGSQGAVAGQIQQIQLLSGTSEIRLENGSVTLQAGEVVRNPGATVMVGGEGKGSFDIHKTGYDTALGSTGRLLSAGGMARHLKGGGGPAGSTRQSIIPWMTVGTYENPGVSGMATYDPEKGVRGLSISEYDSKLQGTPDRNVWVDNATLGKGVSQTVNAVVFRPYYGMEIGAGSTLTITSGFLQFLGSSLSGPAGPSAIGFHPHKGDWQAVAGTIDFGPAEGVIWSNFDGKLGANMIGAVLAGSGGLTFSGTNTLILLAASTYTGRTCIGSGVLQLGDVIPNQARLGDGDVEVAAGATLRIMANVRDGIADTATVSLLEAGSSFAGVLDLGPGVNETVAGLVLDGKAQPAGTYGGKESKATQRLERHFTGAGMLTVTRGKGK